MSQSDQELEVKFAVASLEPYLVRLQALGAAQVQPSIHEVNLRFDTPDGDLGEASQVLRLRQDSQSRLTFKGPGQIVDGVRQRRELEFSVSDFGTARAFLEALGYQVVWMYEKYRQAFKLDDVIVTLDQMPFGVFLEVEGPDGPSIQATAARLDLDWDGRILDSYSVLFQRVKQYLGLDIRDLSFANFQDIAVPATAFSEPDSA